ncbi:arylsulfatase [Postechiella marina]
MVCLCLFSLGLVAQNKKKPNVIIIITDDQGYGDIAAHGNKVIKTPHLDNLHDNGIRLTNFHGGTTCAPSRSGLLSGVEGHRAGVWHTIGGCNILREKFVAMPQIFKNNGYSTGIYGKWHLGDAYPYLPENRGFDESVCHGAGGIGQTPDFWNNDYFDDTYMRNGKPEKFKGYCTDVFFNEAIDFIERKKDKPFFVYISTNAPHGPLNVPEKYYNIYKNETAINEQQKAYYGMITNIDDNVGILDEKLKSLGIKDDTILIFLTDNGTAAGYKIVKGVEQGYNAGMKGLKGSAYDGGHRVPFFIQWNNGGLKGGKPVDELTMNYDVLPTLMDLCDLKNTTNSQFDGVSLKPLFKRKTKKWTNRYAVVDKNKTQQPVKWKMSAVMDNEWRLIDGKELYHIKKDIGQKTDVATQNPEKVSEMRKAYEKWWQYVSEDFSKYEAYKVGGEKSKTTSFTVHDLHSNKPLAWNQAYIRNPLHGKKPALANDGYWMIDVQETGEYEISLSRWPEESGLAFTDTVKTLGKDSPWYVSRPSSISLNIEKATVDVAALHLEEKLNSSKKNIIFKVRLSQGPQQLKAHFINTNKEAFSAFYVKMKQLN